VARTRTARSLVGWGYGFAVADVAIVPCADAGVIAALHRATVAVAYREYFPDTRRRRSPSCRPSGLSAWRIRPRWRSPRGAAAGQSGR
jgi:hypothetical protein